VIEDDSPCVLVRVNLRPSTYRAIVARVGAENIGATVSFLAFVRERHTAGETTSELALVFGVSKNTVLNVVKEKTA